jgi:hypothetical protein
MLRAQGMLAVTGEDRLDGGLSIDLVDDDDPRPCDLVLTEGVHPAMQILARRHPRNCIDVPVAESTPLRAGRLVRGDG